MCFSEQHTVYQNKGVHSKLHHRSLHHHTTNVTVNRGQIRRSRGGHHHSTFNLSETQDGFIPIITSKTRARPRSYDSSDRRSCLVQVPITKPDSTDKHVTKFVLINSRSVCNKTNSINDYIVQNEVDVMPITESWIKATDSTTASKLLPDTHSMLAVPRLGGKRGGGVAVVYRKGFETTLLDSTSSKNFNEFEHLDCVIKQGRSSVRLCVVYRPPGKLSGTKFLDEWATLLEPLSVCPEEVIITGDLNFHLQDITDIDACSFLKLLDSFQFVQHVKEPTHIRGDLLDVCHH